ncbi:MAG: Maf family protein [Bryobacter sp.]|nr:Maf family protein [Bryobacter sp.]
MDSGITLPKVVLASQSPRRLQLLRMIGIEPEVRVTNIPEVRAAGEAPTDYVMRLAREKAAAIGTVPGKVVVAADTTVVLDAPAGPLVLEKPQSAEEAQAMLRQLSGRTHWVHTGFQLLAEGWSEEGVESARVHFHAISEEEILAYVATGEPMDKAGAYAIQGLAARFVRGLEGCYYNVMGLPVSRIYQLLKAKGESRTSWPSATG